jgi:hypothetical protein
MTSARVSFWLAELRSPSLLVELVALHPSEAALVSRPAVTAASRSDVAAVERELALEQAAEVAADREYSAPLKRELELLRQSRPRDAR